MNWLDVKSEVGKGSVFTVYLPLVDRPKEERGKDEPEGASVVGGTERILVVDDEPSQRFLARKSLERLGYEIAEADGGRQALERFEKAKKAGEDSPCDLVLLDMLMEIDFDGLTTYKEMIKLYPEQKAIISSGYAGDEEAGQKARALGVDWLTKPYQLDDLARCVRKRLVSD